jgi:PAS domain S-box-containing protein
VVEGSIQGIVIVRDEIILYVNPAMVRMFGYEEPEELIGKNLLETLVEPEEWDQMRGRAAMIERGELLPISPDWKGRRKDSRRIWIQSTATSIAWQGRSAILGVYVDVTEQKEMEEALKESEKKYRTLFDNAADLICVINTKGNFLDLNEKFEEESGYSREEMLGQNVFQCGILEEASVGKTLAHLGEMLSGRESPIFEVKGIGKDGDIIPYELRAVPLIKDGEIVAVQAILRNITERTRALEALKESEEKYRNLVELANDGIAIIQDGVVKYVNPHLAELVGYRVEEIEETAFLEYIYPDEAERVAQYHLQRMADEDVPSTYEAALKHRQGTRIDVEFNVSVISYEGKPAAFAIIRDLTERKRLEAEFQRFHRMESLGTLAGGIAHNFNNLLTAIMGNVSLALMQTDKTELSYERLKNIKKSVQSGARLTNQLLGYARKGKYDIRTISLNQLVEETSSTFTATKKEIRVHIDLSQDLSAIEADQGQIEQVLWNIYINAADAMPRGGDLFLKTRNVSHDDIKGKAYRPKPGDYAVLTIEDTGTGMDQKTMDRIFDPFFTTKELGRGTGLGLASVYGIVKAHKGYIDVESGGEQGTAFTVYLPTCGEPVSRQVKPAEQVVNGTETVLLVDDEELVLEAVVQSLQTLGYNVIGARGGREAVQVYQLHQRDIDVVVLDMVMPDMGGGEVFGHLRAMNPDIGVLLASGYSIEGQASEILEQGCDAFIQKPFNVKDLSQKIREILDKKRAG